MRSASRGAARLSVVPLLVMVALAVGKPPPEHPPAAAAGPSG
jgi:hypothetical protein